VMNTNIDGKRKIMFAMTAIKVRWKHNQWVSLLRQWWLSCCGAIYLNQALLKFFFRLVREEGCAPFVSYHAFMKYSTAERNSILYQKCLLNVYRKLRPSSNTACPNSVKFSKKIGSGYLHSEVLCMQSVKYFFDTQRLINIHTARTNECTATSLIMSDECTKINRPRL
jgi:hypothetical protein